MIIDSHKTSPRLHDWAPISSWNGSIYFNFPQRQIDKIVNEIDGEHILAELRMVLYSQTLLLSTNWTPPA